ncbi:conserved Plasmodium protein, unknown function [Plasmodium sp. gorilla clade G2]|uniref:conserved Plasmodium protein, unknown function n=1 Tax=Plasmodium sp. gorilla clade G2 TaxID=880535 RepID=UPI000D21ADB6|nr:conserved Plasmodium protein, unknown function [Plasmodium sp. gorilla clade G2]SOV14102.1 conserved Plasmodium protein, unknown function [Plasmodium sp. gorilla clade G2]
MSCVLKRITVSEENMCCYTGGEEILEKKKKKNATDLLIESKKEKTKKIEQKKQLPLREKLPTCFSQNSSNSLKNSNFDKKKFCESGTKYLIKYKIYNLIKNQFYQVDVHHASVSPNLDKKKLTSTKNIIKEKNKQKKKKLPKIPEKKKKDFLINIATNFRKNKPKKSSENSNKKKKKKNYTNQQAKKDKSNNNKNNIINNNNINNNSNNNNNCYYYNNKNSNNNWKNKNKNNKRNRKEKKNIYKKIHIEKNNLTIPKTNRYCNYKYEEYYDISDEKMEETNYDETYCYDEELKNDSKTTIYDESVLKKKIYNCDVNHIFDNFCNYFNCVDKKESMNDDTANSEITLNSNNIKTQDIIIDNNQKSFLYEKNRQQNINVYKQTSDKKSKWLCSTADDSHNEYLTEYERKIDSYDNINNNDNKDYSNIHKNVSIANNNNITLNYDTNDFSSYTTQPIQLFNDQENNTYDIGANIVKKGKSLYEETRKISNALFQMYSTNINNNNINNNNINNNNKGDNNNHKLDDNNDNNNNNNNNNENVDKLCSKNKIEAPTQSLLTTYNNQSLNCQVIIDKNIVFIQIKNFSQKIDEYISDEKIFRAQKLIDHVKKYIEFYINYYKKYNDKEVVEKLEMYHEMHCMHKNIKYNINNLKVNIIMYFLNFFHLNDMYSILNDYSYYFSVDMVNSYTSESNTNSNENTNSINHSDINNIKAKNSIYSYAPSELGGLYNSSIKCYSIDESMNSSKMYLTPNVSNQNNNNINVSNNEAENVENLYKNDNLNNNNNNNNDNINMDSGINNNSKCNTDDSDFKYEDISSVIVDKIYHQQYNNSNMLNGTKTLINQKSIYPDNGTNRKNSNRHMVKIIQKYSRRFKKFRKSKQNSEGWIKENDKYLDLSHRVDKDNNISVHIRAKLPYEVNRILSILNETELSVNWAPFLTSAKKIKNLSRASAIITQLYEYPIIGKKESLMYCLGANSLEELGCIILCCKAPPEFNKDILFYENMCEKININKFGEIIKVKEIPIKFKKTYKEVTFFDYTLPEPVPKLDRQRAANLCFLLHPMNNGKSTVLELFLHFENEFKYTPIKMVTFFIKKIVKNMYENIIKSCRNYDLLYSEFLMNNAEFYIWLDDQIKRYMKGKNDSKLLDSISLESYDEPEHNEELDSKT